MLLLVLQLHHLLVDDEGYAVADELVEASVALHLDFGQAHRIDATVRTVAEEQPVLPDEAFPEHLQLLVDLSNRGQEAQFDDGKCGKGFRTLHRLQIERAHYFLGLKFSEVVQLDSESHVLHCSE